MEAGLATTGFGSGALAGVAGLAGTDAADGGTTGFWTAGLPAGAGAAAVAGALAARSPVAWPVGSTPVIAAMPTADKAMTETAATAISGWRRGWAGGVEGVFMRSSRVG